MIKDINTALKRFIEAADLQGIATETGDYKTGNKQYLKITQSVAYLKQNLHLHSLLNVLDHKSVGVRLWAASCLLSIEEVKALAVLEEIASSSGIHSLTAKTTINEWKKGNLVL